MKRLAAAAAAAALLVATAAQAQPFPSKPIRIVVPFTPGGPADVIARTVGERAGAALRQPFVIENRGGAAGNIGAELVARSAPDGYTLLLGTNSTHALNAFLYRDMPFDPLRDFTPITLAVIGVIALVVNPNVPAANLAEFIAHAKRNPGRLAYGSSGSGSPHHLAGVLLGREAGIDIVHVPYKGASPAMADVLGGQIAFGFVSMQVSGPQHRAGKARILAVTSGTRFAGLPEVPAIAETFPGFDVSTWLGFFAPAKLPAPILEQLNTEFVRALTAPDVRERFAAAGMAVVANRPDEYARMIRADIERWGRIVPALGIKPD